MFADACGVDSGCILVHDDSFELSEADLEGGQGKIWLLDLGLL